MIDIKSSFLEKNSFVLIAGPCVVENYELLEMVAEKMIALTNQLGIPYIFKASYKKANRTNLNSFTGLSEELAISYLEKLKKKYDIPILTDVHSPAECELVKDIVDVIQIPAFLCRQTELLVAAAHTSKWVNIKKGQFLSPQAMEFAIQKVRDSGNNNVMATERGNSFGYQDLIVDFRSIPIMQSFGVPVIMDCTHSIQQPNQSMGVTGGTPQYISTMAKAAIAVGAEGLFIETHPNPKQALSDGANMIPLANIEELLYALMKLKKALVY